VAEAEAFAQVVQRQRRNSPRAWGSAPGFGNRKAKALKARFTPAQVQYIIDAVPQSLSKVILHIIFSTKDRER
jgi:hypothetical protein